MTAAGDSCLSARKRVGNGEYAGDNAHNYTADVGVPRLAVDQVADQSRQRQDQYDREQPDAHNSGYGIEEHLAGDKELDILCHYHKLRADEHKEHLPYNSRVGPLAILGVVIAVSCNRAYDVVE